MNQSQPKRIAIIGLGYNFRMRVNPLLGDLDPVQVRGFDLLDRSSLNVPFGTVRVADDTELADQLNEYSPDVVLIESPDSCHKAHIRIALESGARLVLCEKPLAATAAEARELAEFCKRREPDQLVRIIDHYANIELVKTLLTVGVDFVGQVHTLEAALFESQDIPEHQIFSHKFGMANFIHHCVAVAGRVTDLGGLDVLDAVWSKHPDSPVPDTYRGATLRHRGQPLTIQSAVGKYMDQPAKHIRLQGSRGAATLDRVNEQLRLTANDGWTMTILGDSDTGYRGLAECLATAKPLSTFLNVDEALAVVQLIERAQDEATKVKEYPTGSVPVYGAGRSICGAA